MSEWIAVGRAALAAARDYSEAVRTRIAQDVAPDGGADPVRLTRAQHRVHGLAWVAASIAAMEATLDWAVRADDAGRLGPAEVLVLRIGLGEYLAQLASGLPMSANEIVRPSSFAAEAEARVLADHPAAARLLADGNTAETRAFSSS